MSLKTKLIVLVAKTEVTYGVDVSPAGADAILVVEPKLTPLNAGKVAYKVTRPAFGNYLQIHTGVHVMCEFDVGMMGSGTLGTAPAFGKLLKACGCSETIVAVTSVIYKSDKASTSSLTLKYYMEGQLHTLLGARGTVSIKFDSQGLPFLSFKFTGLYVAPATAAAPGSLTGLTAFNTPLPVNFDNTTTATLHSAAGVFKNFGFDLANKVNYFDNPGERAVEITDRETSGNITILAPIISTKDYFAIVKANTLGTIKIEHGTVAATKFFFESTGNRVQILDPKYGEDEGRATLEAGLSFVPSNDPGDDDWELRFAAA